MNPRRECVKRCLVVEVMTERTNQIQQVFGRFPYHHLCDHTVENAMACCHVDRLNDVDP